MDRFGPNAVRTHRVNAAEVLKRQLNNAVLALLAATAVISFFLWMWRKTQLTLFSWKRIWECWCPAIFATA
ncbi:hypothetical protein [Mycobacterium vulneris]